MDYDVLCEAIGRDKTGLETRLKLVQMLDPMFPSRYKVVDPGGDFIWESSIEPDQFDAEAIEEIFTQAIESKGGTFKELLY